MNNAKKDKALIIIAICVAVLIAAAVIFIVTKGFQKGRTDPNKARFERELEEKYGEKFVCLNLETHGIAIDPPVVMDAVCAPARDPSLIFNAHILIDLNSTKNTDSYPDELARRQITEEFSDKINGSWHGFTAYCETYFFIENDDIVGDINDDIAGRIKGGTFNWRYYAEKLSSVDIDSEADHACFDFVIIVDSSYNNVSYKDEWNALQKVIEEWLAEFQQRDIDLQLGFYLYFPPSELYAECAEIVRNISRDYDYYSMLNEKLDEERIIELGFDQYIVDEVGYTQIAEEYVDVREKMG